MTAIETDRWRLEEGLQVHLVLDHLLLLDEDVEDAGGRLVLGGKQVSVTHHLLQQVLHTRLQLRVRLKVLHNTMIVSRSLK